MVRGIKNILRWIRSLFVEEHSADTVDVYDTETNMED